MILWKKRKELNEQRADVVKQMQNLVGPEGGNTLTAEQDKQFGELRAKADELGKAIARLDTLHELDEAGRDDIGEGDVEQRGRLGLTDKEKRQYSIQRVLQHLAEGRSVDGFEREMSDEVEKRSGKKPNGIFVPSEILFAPVEGYERRDLNTTAGAGSVPTVKAREVIPLLRARLLVAQLGARLLTGLLGDLSIPKQTATATGYWVTEGNAPDESNATVGQVGLSPNTLGAFTDLTRKFIKQTTLDAEQFVREDLAASLARSLDAAVINGSGTGAEPEGILQDSDITTVPLGADGAAPTWAKVVALETAVATANADEGNLAYVTNPLGRGKLKVVEKATNTARFLWGDDNTVNGYIARASTLVPANLIKGNGSSLSAMIFGDWSSVVVGMWGGLDVRVDPFSQAATGGVRVVALQEVDIAFRHQESFAKFVDMITA
jgi:HK97 family phage major capsid protein